MKEAVTTSRPRSTALTAPITGRDIPPVITTLVQSRDITWCRSRATTRRLPITVHHLRLAGAVDVDLAQVGAAVGMVRALAGAAGHVQAVQVEVTTVRHRATVVVMVVTTVVVADMTAAAMDQVVARS